VGLFRHPLYLIAGLAFGNGALLPLGLSEDFIHIGGEIGVLLLLFMLGLEYTGDELSHNLREGLPAGVVDFALNFSPGPGAGLLLGWSALPSVLPGGVTWISSSGIIPKVLADQGRLNNPETPTVLSILVLEDLAMAIYLPLVAVMLLGGSALSIAVSAGVALLAAASVLFMALRCGEAISTWGAHESDEVVLLSTFGAVLLVSGIAQKLRVSLLSARFWLALRFPVPSRSSPSVCSPRYATCLQRLFSSFSFWKSIRGFCRLSLCRRSRWEWSRRSRKLPLGIGPTRVDLGQRARIRAGLILISRGEFSIVIAGLRIALEPGLGPLSAAYVLFLAVLGPLPAKLVR
jgi:CPA2 family monovalent cation:H+ antiporter-2